MFEMDADEIVLEAAAFDDAPVYDMAGFGAHGVTQVALLENFFAQGAGFAIGDELHGGEGGTLDAVDDFEEAEFDGVGESDAVVQIPWICGLLDGWIGGMGIFGF